MEERTPLASLSVPRLSAVRSRRTCLELPSYLSHSMVCGPLWPTLTPIQVFCAKLSYDQLATSIFFVLKKQKNVSQMRMDFQSNFRCMRSHRAQMRALDFFPQSLCLCSVAAREAVRDFSGFFCCLRLQRAQRQVPPLAARH